MFVFQLTYDYKFDYEDEKHKIPCLCGAPNCRKWMNWATIAQRLHQPGTRFRVCAAPRTVASGWIRRLLHSALTGQHKIPCLCGAPNCRKWMNWATIAQRLHWPAQDFVSVRRPQLSQVDELSDHCAAPSLVGARVDRPKTGSGTCELPDTTVAW